MIGDPSYGRPIDAEPDGATSFDVDMSWATGFARDVDFGFITRDTHSPRVDHPEVVANAEGHTVLRSIRSELARCKAFTFSVAFVSPRAIALLKQELLEFTGRGTIITSDYLSFNSPAAFAELLSLSALGIDVRIHSSKAYHPKGYVFEHENSITVMMGSANLTEHALVDNHEWNLKVTASHRSDLHRQVQDLLALQSAESSALTQEWIDVYAQAYNPPAPRPSRPTTAAVPRPKVEILPNQMQRAALKEIAAVREAGERRAVVISATGTGKTMLSALDVRAAGVDRVLFLAHREQILDRTIFEYQKVLGGDTSDYGKIAGSRKEFDRRYVFATVQSLSRPEHLAAIHPRDFDYVIIDEAHRSGAETYQRILSHLQPEFVLGMTATPERLDGFNVFELFDHNVPYEIRLNDALEADMLTPFHYYGVTDVTFDDGTTADAETDLRYLISPERIRHLVNALETYGHAGVPPRGLIFASRKSEAAELARALTGQQVHGRYLRCLALSGDDTVAAREAAVAELEAGNLHYLVTVDVFNEGVDIPTVNQIVMLRNTQSPTVFVQQLGRGLRKAPDKDYVVVIDVIGNYANNYMIPIALFGDSSLNKESIRQKLISAEESGVLAGLSSVRFDRISQQRVLDSLKQVKLDSLTELKRAMAAMRNRVGDVPKLWDFHRFDSTDPVILATKKRHYPALTHHLMGAPLSLSAEEDQALHLLSTELMTSKRLHEFVYIELLLRGWVVTPEAFHSELIARGLRATSREINSTPQTFTLEGYPEAEVKKYQRGVAEKIGDGVRILPHVLEAYRSGGQFADELTDVIRTGQAVVSSRYHSAPLFTIGRQYGRRDAARLLGWARSFTAIIYGYKVDVATGVCPIFVTLHKSDDVAASVAYQDTLVDESTMRWFSKSRRTLVSDEIQPILSNEVELHVFVKRDDADGGDFYYLGQARSEAARQEQMPGKDGELLDVVTMDLKFLRPIERSLFDYFHPTITE